MFNKSLGKTLHRGDRGVLSHDFKSNISSNKVIDAGTLLQEKTIQVEAFKEMWVTK